MFSSKSLLCFSFYNLFQINFLHMIWELRLAFFPHDTELPESFAGKRILPTLNYFGTSVENQFIGSVWGSISGPRSIPLVCLAPSAVLVFITVAIYKVYNWQCNPFELHRSGYSLVDLTSIKILDLLINFYKTSWLCLPQRLHWNYTWIWGERWS